MIEVFNKEEVWAVVLAAGKSERMGIQKLLLPFGHQTIIEKVIDNILQAGILHILVVLGSHREEIEKVLKGKPVLTCLNELYSEGMHTSVICGFRNLPEMARAALVFLGDQPFIPPEVMLSVIKTWQQSDKGIIVPTFQKKRGHPTLFDLKLKEAIFGLDPATGLHSVISRFPDEVFENETIFPEITRDIDTKNDYLNELNKFNYDGRKNQV